MKHFEYTLEIYVYSHCNMCNIPIYFYNTNIKHLQHTFQTPETLETYVCNMRFQRNISMLLRRMEARLCVEVTGVELASSTHRARWGQHGGSDDAEGGWAR
jgi:hypothetical protein